MGFDPTSFMIADGNAESANNPLIGYHDPSRSTAAGQFGITDSTWRGLMNTRPDLGLSMSNRLDPAANQRAIGALTNEWQGALSSKGLPVDNTTLGLASLLGPAAATALLSSDPNMDVGSALAKAVGPQQAQQMITANPELLGGGKNVGSVIQANAARMSQQPGAQPSIPSAQPQGLPGMAQMPAHIQVQSQSMPPMPQGFGAAPAPSGAPAVPQVNDAGHQGDPMVAMGLAMMGGNGFHDAMGKAGAAYQAAQDQTMQNARYNAQFQNDALNRDADAGVKAAQAAGLRADAWKTLNPGIVTPQDALSANVQQRGQDIQYADATARNAYMTQMAKGPAQQFVVPAPDGSAGKTIDVQSLPTGGQRYIDTSTGQQLPGLPQGAVPLNTFNQDSNRLYKSYENAAKPVNDILNSGQSADDQLQQLEKIKSDLAKPGALAQPGALTSIGRAIDSFTGQSIFGDKSAEDIAKMDMGQQQFAGIKNAAHGTFSRMTQQEFQKLGQNYAGLTTSPQARADAINTMEYSLQRQSAMADAWKALSVEQKNALKATPGGAGINEWADTFNGQYTKAHPLVPPADPAQAAPAAPVASPVSPANPAPTTAPAPGNRPPLSSIFGN